MLPVNFEVARRLRVILSISTTTDTINFSEIFNFWLQLILIISWDELQKTQSFCINISKRNSEHVIDVPSLSVLHNKFQGLCRKFAEIWVR